jgi:hypothetical protein
MEVAGQPLLLNGAALRSFLVFKVDIATLYLAAKQTTLDGVVKQPGAKRIRLIMLRDLSAYELQKHFMADFRAASVHTEWVTMIPEVDALRSWFNQVRVKKGDVLTLDWVPKVGLTATHNGKTISEAPIGNELVFNIILRVFVGSKADPAARAKLLGVPVAAQ